MKERPGRNDPCHCGSGRKYKHCCLARDEAAPAAHGNRVGDVLAELRREIEARDFASDEALEAFTGVLVERRNRAPLDDFHGLSPDQMAGLLYAAFDSPHLITFPEEIRIPVRAPILTLFLHLAEAAGERGIKCTSTGNLPPALCRSAAEAFAADGYTREADIFGIHKEQDFVELHVTRIVAKAAGLIRHYRGRVLLSSTSRKLLQGPGPGAIYPKLLRAHAGRYNWAYTDGYPAMPFIQQSFLFTIYLLQRYGGEERPQDFYEEAYLRAFPAVIAEAGVDSWSTPEDQVCRCYSLRTLRRFAAFLGLAVVKCQARGIGGECRIRKTPLTDEAVRFRL